MRRFSIRGLVAEIKGPYIELTENRDEKDVIEYGTVDKVLQISDVHLGYENSRVDKYNKFMDEVVPREDPDLVLITGDFFEFWRSSIEDVLIDHQQEIFKAFELSNTDTDVLLNAGNHDYRFIVSNAPVDVADEILFESGGREFKAIHGQKYDPKNANNYTNEAMCLTSEETGQLMSDIWDTWKGASPANPVINRIEFGFPGIASPVGQLEHMANPEVLTESQASERHDLIEQAVEADNERFILYGHIHSAQLSKSSVNAGSLTDGQTKYVVVEDGAVSIKDL